MSARIPDPNQDKNLNRQTGVYVPIIISAIGALASIVTAYITTTTNIDKKVPDAVRNATAVELSRQLPPGTIVASLLAPSTFSKLTGGNGITDGTWIPCEGGETQSAKYQEATGMRAVPDLRGTFLRGLNVFTAGQSAQRAEFRDESDEGDRRLPGSLQTDTIFLGKTSGEFNAIEELGFVYGGESKMYRFDKVESGSATLRLGKETVPRNAAVYYYCKVK